MNNIVLINPAELKPHEQIRLTRALWIFAKIIISGGFTKPLLIDSRTKTILDGHHRCWIAKKLGFKRIPCYCIDYLDEQEIRVHPRRSDIPVSKSEVINMALSGKVFPHKTTRHEYNVPIFEPLSLNQLMN